MWLGGMVSLCCGVVLCCGDETIEANLFSSPPPQCEHAAMLSGIKTASNNTGLALHQPVGDEGNFLSLGQVH